MKKINSSAWLLMAAILIVPLIAFEATHWLQKKYQRLPVLNENSNVGLNEYHFINQNSQARSFKTWNNKIIVTDFFFTACPSICPKLTAAMRSVSVAFNIDKHIQLLSFTVAPKRDSAEKLLQYATKRNDIMTNWEFLTGDKKDIYQLARKHFFLTATEGDGGDEDFIHSDKIVLEDAQHKIRGYYDGTSDIETQQLIHDIKKLENEN